MPETIETWASTKSKPMFSSSIKLNRKKSRKTKSSNRISLTECPIDFEEIQRIKEREKLQAKMDYFYAPYYFKNEAELARIKKENGSVKE